MNRLNGLQCNGNTFLCRKAISLNSAILDWSLLLLIASVASLSVRTLKLDVKSRASKTMNVDTMLELFQVLLVLCADSGLDSV
jgi:hypothetical protein